MKRGKGWMLSLGVLVAALLLPELVLRAVGFRYESGIQFGFPRPDSFARLVQDEKLFWRLPPSTPGVNSLGFTGREVLVPKPEDTFRIMFLGDSCTQQGYPSSVELILNARATPPRRYECVNLALAGYSSHQGRVLAETYVPSFDPDLVVVYFGWNDHWLARGAVDSQKQVVGSPSSNGQSFATTFQGLRILQGVQALAARYSGAKTSELLDSVRVPAAQYRINLEAIEQICGQHGAPVLYLTAPSSFQRFGVKPFLVGWGLAADEPSVIAMHTQYNQIVREVSGSKGALLLDLEAEFEPRKDLDQIMMRDGIHFTPDGLSVLAIRIAQFIEQALPKFGPPMKADK